MLKSMPIFIGVITFMIVVRTMLKKGNNGYDKAVDEFVKRELESNKVIKDFNALDIHFIEPS